MQSLAHPSPFRRILSSERTGQVLILACLLALAATLRLLVGPLPLDDAHITFRYARNISLGLGFVYNPGEPILGTSTPLLTLVLATLATLGADIPISAFLLGVMGDLCTITLIYLLCARQGLALPGLLVAALVATATELVSISVGGMETSLYVAAIVAAVYLYALRREVPTALACAVAAGLRPDGIILALVLAGHYVYTTRRFPLRGLATMAAAGAPWILFATLWFGSPVPNSIAAKSVQFARPDATFLASPNNLLSELTYTPLRLAMAPFALFGAWQVWRRIPGLMPWLLWGLAYAATFVAVNAFQIYRWYLVPPVPLYFALACTGLYHSAWSLGARMPAALRRRAERLRPLAFVTVAILAATGAFHLQQQMPELYRTNYEPVDVVRAAAQDIVREAGTGGLVAADPAPVGYHYPGPILDWWGLTSPAVIGLSPAETVVRFRPDWIVIWNSFIGDDLRRADWFTAAYTLRWSFTHPYHPEVQLLVFRRASS